MLNRAVFFYRLLLTYLENLTFANLYILKFLNLSFNQLEVIETSLFPDLYNLETLDLSFNRFKFIGYFVFRSSLLLKIVYINENSNSLILSKKMHLIDLSLLLIFTFLSILLFDGKTQCLCWDH